MNQGERQTDGDRREAGGDAFFRGGEDDEDEERRHDDFDDQCCLEGIPAGRMLTVAVGSESLGHVEPCRTAGNDIEHAAGSDTAENLRYDVRRQFSGGETPGRPQAEGNGWVDMAARDRADGVSHGEEGEAKGE